MNVDFHMAFIYWRYMDSCVQTNFKNWKKMDIDIWLYYTEWVQMKPGTHSYSIYLMKM